MSAQTGLDLATIRRRVRAGEAIEPFIIIDLLDMLQHPKNTVAPQDPPPEVEGMAITEAMINAALHAWALDYDASESDPALERTMRKSLEAALFSAQDERHALEKRIAELENERNEVREALPLDFPVERIEARPKDGGTRT